MVDGVGLSGWLKLLIQYYKFLCNLTSHLINSLTKKAKHNHSPNQLNQPLNQFTQSTLTNSTMKILIRLPNWLGDVVMGTAFVSAVQQFFPGAQVDVVIKKELGPIAALIDGLTTIHPFSKLEYKGLPGVYRFGKSLRSQNYDLFFSLPGSVSAAVMGWASGAKQRVGYGKEGGFFLLTKTCKKPVNVHRAEEYISLLEQFTGIVVSEKKVALHITSPVKSNNRVLVNFNSEAESRRMPVAKAIGMVNLLTQTFKSQVFTFIGSPNDATFIGGMLTGVENPRQVENYAGKTDLPGLANLMAGSKVLLTTDSGPAHLANSVKTPVIALFGAGNEHNTAPYNKANLTVIRAGKLECEPCVRNECKLYGIPKCMQLLDDAKIINALSLYI
jgi:heptosyltransferase-2